MYDHSFSDCVGYQVCKAGQNPNLIIFPSHGEDETDDIVFELCKWIRQRAVKASPLTDANRYGVVTLGYHLEKFKPSLRSVFYIHCYFVLADDFFHNQLYF